MDYRTILELVFMSGAGYCLYQWLSYVIQGMEQEDKPDDIIDWTDIDELYYQLFTAHVLSCSECDPQDKPCTIGDAILINWRNTRNG